MRTKRKYSLFGLEFGPKKAVFETEKMKLPVYQETDRHKRYYAAVRQEDVVRIRREGFSAELGAKKAALPQSVKQFNTQGRIRFFTNTANAQAYGKATIADGYAIVEFVLPEFQEFTADVEADAPATKPSNLQSMQMLSAVPSTCIKSIKEQQ